MASKRSDPSALAVGGGGAANVVKQTWTAEKLVRQFGVSLKQLESWQRQDLFPRRGEYSFDDVAILRLLLKLKESGVSPKRMQTAFAALRAQAGDEREALQNLGIEVDGKRVRLKGAHGRVEAQTGQMVLDFDAGELKKMLSFPKAASAKAEGKRAQMNARLEAEACFQRGLELEQSGADKRAAIEAYEEALQHFPEMAGAMVNIGTIYFNARRWREAERYYEKALAADPGYPLAHFNVANLHEEVGRTSLAIQHYKKAIELSPTYADAHYNLALLYQTRERPMEALRHWKTYLQLDASSHWASIARRELNRLKEATLVRSRSSSESA